MIFGTENERFELSLAEWKPGTPPPGLGDDLLFNVEVAAGGFAAGDQVWITATDWSAFLAAFRNLERTRQGEAELVGIMPEEFRLRIFAFDRAGHCAIEGHVARPRYAAGAGRELRLVFHLEIDPGELPVALREFESVPRAG